MIVPTEYTEVWMRSVGEGAPTEEEGHAQTHTNTHTHTHHKDGDICTPEDPSSSKTKGSMARAWRKKRNKYDITYDNGINIISITK